MKTFQVHDQTGAGMDATFELEFLNPDFALSFHSQSGARGLLQEQVTQLVTRPDRPVWS
jgi:hypothetical protein